MTEKRFQWVYIKDNLLELRDNEIVKVFNNERLEELLNELHDENEELKQRLKIYKNDGLETLNDLERAYENNKKSLSNIEQLDKENNELKQENEQYKSIFFELVETALTDKNCRELYCKGILDIFDKANSLNQAREMIKEHLK